MEFRKTLLSAAAAAAMLALAGGAYAQSSPSQSAPGGSMPSAPAPSTMGSPPSSSDQPSATGSPSMGAGSSGAVQSGQSSIPPAFIVGKSVTNAQGDKVGTVSKIEGNNVIVSVGGFLGIGSHDVSVPWSQLTLAGTGDDATLQTALTRDELKAMPEYKEPATGSTNGSMRSGPTGGATGGSTR